MPVWIVFLVETWLVATVAEALALAVQYHQSGALPQAEQLYRQILEVAPQQVEVYMHLATLYRQRGQLDEAVASLQGALRVRPDSFASQTNLGTLFSERGQMDEAIACYQAALRINPNFPQAHNNLGVALAKRGRHDEALASYREALRLNPAFAEAYANLGNLLRERDEFAQAVDCYDQALRLNPTYAKAHNNRGMALLELGRVPEALANFERAVLLQADFAEAHMNRGVALLLLGRLPEGFAEYEWRSACKGYPEMPLNLPHWDGSDLKGKTILLTSEQGLGDTLQFIRYAALVKERGATVVATCPMLLYPLLAGSPNTGIDQLVPKVPGAASLATVQAVLPSLPRLLGTTLETVPARVPYLAPDPARVDYWHAELAKYSGLKIGIAWKGSAANPKDRWRSVPLAQFTPLARLEGVQLFSLQVGPGREELQALAGSFAVTDLGTSFAETAAIMKNLDLVISVDSALAHLAGALAVPVWVTVQFAPDWRWMLEREDSPWYPTMRLFRQREREKWDEVFERMANEVGRIVAPSARKD
jgi:Flp pilus assembly protein TadD